MVPLTSFNALIGFIISIDDTTVGFLVSKERLTTALSLQFVTIPVVLRDDIVVFVEFSWFNPNRDREVSWKENSVPRSFKISTLFEVYSFSDKTICP